MNARKQLTHFVPLSASIQLQAARQWLDPVQASLISAHVTLCREDEIADTAGSAFWSRLAAAKAAAVTLGFGPPEAFHGHGILLPCVSGEEDFKALRRFVLDSDRLRYQAPPITLAHPRNPKSPHNTLSDAARFLFETTITFTSVSLIQQTETSPWRVLEQYTLVGRESSQLPR
jgi:2'-5' RNA ligase superfamily protein